MNVNPAHTQATNPWLIYPAPNANARLRLYCFHYAGGGAHAYQTWSRNLPASIEVCAIQLPGRGARLREAPLTSPGVLIPALADALTQTLKEPFAFFGHSMGSLVAFELARLLRRRGQPTPVHLFVSGRGGPRQRDAEANLSEMPEDELIAELLRYDGAPKEVLENTELMRIMLPTIRADFKFCESYRYEPETLLDCPISAFGGLADVEVSRERLESWREETNAAFSLRMLPGGHFYLQNAEQPILQAVTGDLRRFLSSP